MRKEEYINEVISKIENKKARREVEKELSAHIDDRISYYTDAGWDEDSANDKAMEHMGKAEDIAEKMGKLHNEYRRKCYIAFICLVIAHIVFPTLKDWSYFFTPPQSSLILSEIYIPIIYILLIGAIVLLTRLSNKNGGFAFLLALGIELVFIFYEMEYLFAEDGEKSVIINLSFTVALFVMTVFTSTRSDGMQSGIVKKASTVILFGLLVLIISFVIRAVLSFVVWILGDLETVIEGISINTF